VRHTDMESVKASRALPSAEKTNPIRQLTIGGMSVPHGRRRIGG
jgi:hypothetical protein